MQINPVNSLRSVLAGTAAATTAPTTAPAGKALGQADFLKLLSVQFQSQDPMKPVDDTAFIAQMAQFTALDQSSSLLTQVTAMNTKQDFVTANNYIGRNVTLNDGKGGTVTGAVTGVDASSGAPLLQVNKNTYPLSAVLLVKPGTPGATTPTQPVIAGGS